MPEKVNSQLVKDHSDLAHNTDRLPQATSYYQKGLYNTTKSSALLKWAVKGQCASFNRGNQGSAICDRKVKGQCKLR